MSQPTEEQVEKYDRLVPMLTAAHKEMSELSKKKQDGIVNTLKIRNINRLLDELLTVLGDDPSRGFLEKLDEETLPQNSDVVLLLSQWQAALQQFKKRHTDSDLGSYSSRWITVENPKQ
ncbi:hypothetical protein [Streptomyces lincolnensis]|uniref:hypothetical protein n=1 Tax=Streptomyces lincolnensis TaxID=1915 RepID=UPI0037CE1BB6